MTEEREGYLGDQKLWAVVEKTLLASVQEQRRSRRWGIFFKLMTLFYVLIFFGLMLVGLSASQLEMQAQSNSPHTALINVQGVIAEEESANADAVIKALREAFSNDYSKAVLLRINSPGGSPVQSAYIYDEIRRLRARHPQKQVVAVIADIGASGAYYIASAADFIYADKGSLVGSIGVTASGFGYVDAIGKLGVQRRIYTAGAHKNFLDPFEPENPEESQFWKGVLGTVHQQFINSVIQGRGERLKYREHPELFSGLVWSGEQALPLGLIDGLGSADTVAREVVGEDTVVDYTITPNALDRFAREMGSSAAQKIALLAGLQGVRLQ